MKLHKITSKNISLLFIIFLFLTVLIALPSTTFAKQKEWTDKKFKFSSIKTVLVKKPILEEIQHIGEQNQELYNFNDAQWKPLPENWELLSESWEIFRQKCLTDATIMLDEELPKKLKELSKYNFIYENGLKSTTITPDDVDVILTIKVIALGQDEGENITGWTISSFLSANAYSGYGVIHIAEAEILLTDVKTDKVIWRYSERKNRYVGKRYSGSVYAFTPFYSPKQNPVIVLKDVFNNAFEKIPLSKP